MNDPFEKLVRIRPFVGGDLGPVMTAARADNHSILKPSDVLMKNGEIVGALEIATLPLALVWLHTQKVQVRDSLNSLAYVESIMHRMHTPQYILPCSTKSPLLPFIERLGYLNLGQFNLFLKKT